MDANHHIQLGSVYKGREPVPRSDITSIYGGIHIPLNIIDDQIHALGGGSSSRKLIQFLDWFSIPEIALFADISDVRNNHHYSWRNMLCLRTLSNLLVFL